MKRFDPRSEFQQSHIADFPDSAGGVELIECDFEPIVEREIPEDPNRWTLPAIREGAAVGVLLCLTSMMLPAIVAAGLSKPLRRLIAHNDFDW